MFRTGVGATANCKRLQLGLPLRTGCKRSLSLAIPPSCGGRTSLKARVCFKDYEEKLEELKRECHEARMSLGESQTENEKLRSELTSKTFYIDTLANVVEAQQDELKELKEKTDSDVLKWMGTLEACA